MKHFVSSCKLMVLLWVMIGVAGCGGGSSTTSTSTNTGTSGVIKTANVTINKTALGSSEQAEVQVGVTSTAGTIVSSSVLIDVLDSSGNSFLGGPQHMILLSTGLYDYTIGVSSNSTPSANYNIVVSATDSAGNKLTNSNIGTVTLP